MRNRKRIIALCCFLVLSCFNVGLCSKAEPANDADLQDDTPIFTIDGTTLTSYSKENKNRAFLVPDGITEIGKSAFYGCEYLKEVLLPEGVHTIQDCAFAECVNLEKIVLQRGLTNIGEGAFGWCESLKSIVIPEGVVVIENGAFEECRNLEKVILPDGLVFIGGAAFQTCISLKEIELPSSLLVIGDSAFSETASLKRIVLPEKLEVLGDGSFRKSSIEEIVILTTSGIHIDSDIVDEDSNVDIYLAWAESDFAEEIMERYDGYENIRVIIMDEEDSDIEMK